MSEADSPGTLSDAQEILERELEDAEGGEALALKEAVKWTKTAWKARYPPAADAGGEGRRTAADGGHSAAED